MVISIEHDEGIELSPVCFSHTLTYSTRELTICVKRGRCSRSIQVLHHLLIIWLKIKQTFLTNISQNLCHLSYYTLQLCLIKKIFFLQNMQSWVQYELHPIQCCNTTHSNCVQTACLTSDWSDWVSSFIWCFISIICCYLSSDHKESLTKKAMSLCFSSSVLFFISAILYNSINEICLIRLIWSSKKNKE